MRKILGFITLTAMCICTCAVITITVQAVELEPLKVGEGQAYPTLTVALAHVQEGQIIQILGNVTETNPADPVVIGKRVIIQGDGVSVYKITGWSKTASMLQIAAEGVVIKDLHIDLNGTAAGAAAPIFVDASGLKMENISISNTTRATKIIDLQGNSANLKGVSITAGANVTGIYSETSPANLILEDCDFYNTAGTAKAVSLPSPAGLTLTKCDFSFTGAGAGAGNSGLIFTAPSGTAASETLVASGCRFDMKSGTGIDLNGYNALLVGCEFIFDAGSGKGINSETSSNADLLFTGCEFKVGKTEGAKITGANCVALKGNTGNIQIDQCTMTASDPSIGLTTPSAIIINAADSEFNSLKISGSSFAFNVGANSAIGVNAKAIGNLIISDSGFIVDAPSVKCINAETIGTGRISKTNFAVGTASAAANSVICVNVTGADSLIVEDSSNFTINAKSTGIVAGTKSFIVKNSGFYLDAASAKGITINGAETGSISNCEFAVKNSGAIGLGIINFTDILFTGNTFDLSTGGKGINMTSSSSAASGNVVIDNNTFNVNGDATIVGFLFEHLDSLRIKNTKIKTPGGTTASTTCIRGNHIKTFELDNVDLDFDSPTVNGIVINETKPPSGDEVKATITNITANLKEKSSRAIRIFYANGVLVDNYAGKIESAATNSNLLFFQNSKNIEVRNCNYKAEATGATFLSFSSDSKTSEESSDFKIHHNILTVENKAQGIIATQANHNVEIYENTISLSHATKGVVIAYGRNNNVYNNRFIANNCEMAIVSDGVDEIASFAFDVDNDIYDINGNIIDVYRNKIYHNKFTGSYERGLYISNNGDIVSDNNFSEATFNYESTSGTNINTQIIVVYCRDVKILNNKFAKARASDNPVVRINNAVISEVTGNITQLFGGASEVLFVQGSTSLAPNGMKYPESIAVHDATNTINGVTPIEIVNEWNDPDNLTFEYILRMPETLPPAPGETGRPSPPPGTQNHTPIPDPDESYHRIDESGISPIPDQPINPQTGKSDTFPLHILGLTLLIVAGLIFSAGHKRT